MTQVWFSGAIFSRRSLFREHALREDLSCEELCAQAFARWRYDCPQYLNGEYALVIREDDGETVFCARDHVGAHPFYYSVMDGRLYWAGSIAELLPELPRKPPLDERYVATYLSRRRYSDQERTFFDGVFKLPAGHSLLFRNGSLKRQRYWFPDRVPELELGSEQAYVEAGRQTLADAVADRVSDRVAVHVSGGLDSTAIAALAMRTAQERGLEPPIGYAWHQAGPDEADENLVEVVRHQLAIEVHTCPPDFDMIRDLLQDDPVLGVQALDLLHEKSVQVAAARQGITTILSGWGGDEGLSFDGRGLARHYLAQANVRQLRAIGPGGPSRAVTHAIAAGIRERFRERQAKGVETSFADDMLLKRSPPYARPTRQLSAGPRSLQLSALQLGKHVPRLEGWAESGRRLGIIYRYPLLDRRVLEFALSIPPHLFRQGGQRRWLFREMMQGVVPEQVRLHLSKREQVRVHALEEILIKAINQVGDRLAPEGQYERARFVNMDKLRDTLRDGATRAYIRQSPLQAAIQFLDT